MVIEKEILERNLISAKSLFVQSFRSMLAYIYYSLDWHNVFSCGKVEMEMDTELLSNTGVVDGLIEFCWPLLEK